VKQPQEMANLPPVLRFSYFEAGQRLQASFENSIILTDAIGMGRNRIEVALQHQMPQHNWIARYYDDSRFLIEAPNPRWFSTMSARGYLRLKNSDLPVSRWDPAMDEGAWLRLVWVLVRGFPMKLWFFHEFSRLFEPYGQVLALDQATIEHILIFGSLECELVFVILSSSLRCNGLLIVTSMAFGLGMMSRWRLNKADLSHLHHCHLLHTSRVQGVLVVVTYLRGRGR
jgi:Domain of unknown function (DUF4283)